jgi:MFS family permease
MAFTLSFGTEDERPTYVGLANTLIAPSAILAPLLGGWLADYGGGYQSTFLTAASAGLITLILLHFLVKESRPVYPPDPSRALDSPSSIE